MGSFFASRAALAVFSFVLSLFVVSAANASTETAAFWLEKMQQPEGSFYTGTTKATTRQATLETLVAFAETNKLGKINSTLALGATTDALANTNTEQFSRLVLAKLKMDISIAKELEYIALRQEKNSGFGAYDGHDSDPLSTSSAIQAYTKAGIYSQSFPYAIQYLLDAQKSDGSWNIETNPSNISVTAIAMSALWSVRKQYNVSAALQKASNYLIANRKDNYLWGDTNESALSLIALLQYSEKRDAFANSLSAFSKYQTISGSYDQDVYTTALALRVLSLIDNPASNPELGRITGRLVDAITELPLYNSKVELSNATNGSSTIVYTDSKGVFNLAQLVAGQYSLQVLPVGYETLSWQGGVLSGETKDFGVIKLMPSILTGSDTAIVLGQVTDASDNSPIPAAKISLLERNILLQTDEFGRFQISDLSPGEVTIMASQAGFNSALAKVTLDAGKTIIFSPALTLKNQIASSMLGKVIDKDGNPITNASISFTGANIQTLVSDMQGAFNVSALNIGKTNISISRDGYQTFNAFMDIDAGIEYQLNFTLNLLADNSTENDDPEEPKTSQLKGRIVDSETGQPVINPVIELVDSSGSNKTTIQLDTGFDFTSLAADNYRLRVAAEGYIEFNQVINVPYYTVLTLGDIPLSLDESEPEKQFAAFGHVVDSLSGIPLTGVTVQMSLGGVNSQKSTDQNGFFSFTEMPSHVATLRFVLNGYHSIDYDVIADEMGKGSPIHLRMRPLSLETRLPDLVVSKANTAGVIDNPDDLSISGFVAAQIRNSGTDISSTTAKIFAFYDVNDNGVFESAQDHLLGESFFGALPTDNSIQVSIPVSGQLPFRDAPISLWVDSSASVIEIDESNNVFKTPCQKSCVLFEDDFTFGLASAWKTSTNGIPTLWASNGSALVPGVDAGSLIVGDTDWKDYSAQVDVRFSGNVAGVAGLIFHYLDENNWYQLRLSGSQASLVRKINGVQETIFTKALLSIEAMKFYQLKAELKGSSLKVFLDSSLLYESSSLAIPKGKAGVHMQGTEIVFDNFSVQNCLLSGVLDPVVKWHWKDPQASTTGVYGPVSVAQLTDDNNDGVINLEDTPDIIFASDRNRLVAASGDTGKTLWTAPFSNITPYGSPSVADLDNDGRVEILVVNDSRTEIFIFDNKGALRNRFPTGPSKGDPRDNISIADINHDGHPEIIHGRRVYDYTGKLLFEGKSAYGGMSYYGIVSIAADIDMSGDMEIIAGNTVYNSKGDIVWEQKTIPNEGFNAIGNFDSDDLPEIVVVYAGKIYLLESNGNIIWTATLPGGGAGGPPTVADVDGDGQVEIGVAGATNYVVFETDGSIKWKSTVNDGSSNVTGSSVFDFQGDGKAEIIYADESNFRIYDGSSGQILYQKPNISGTTLEYPVIADIDNDGQAEILFGANYGGNAADRGLYALESQSGSWMPTRSIWNQHSYHITNINDDGSVPQYEQHSWLANNNYRLNSFLDRNPLDLYDLSVARFTFIDKGVGNPAQLSVIVGNGGSIKSSATQLNFYRDVNGVKTLLGSLPVGSLQPNTWQTFVLDNVQGLKSGETISVVVNESQRDKECNSLNNSQDITVTSVRGNIVLTADRTEYNSAVPASFTARLENTGLFSNVYLVHWAVEDIQGNRIAELSSITSDDIASGSFKDYQQLFATTNLYAGQYRLTGTMTDTHGVMVSNASLEFVILATNEVGETAGISAQVTTDKASYRAGDYLRISALLNNQALNAVRSNLSSTVEIISSTGEQIFVQAFEALSLAGGELLPLNAEFKITEAISGAYQVKLTVTDSLTTQVVAQASSTFTIEQDVLVAVTGVVSVGQEVVDRGGLQTCKFEVINNGASLLSNLHLTRSVASIQTDVVIDSNQASVSLASAELHTYTQAISSDNLEAGDYLCALEAKIGDKVKVLASKTFVVKESPIKLGGDITLGDKSRLLVLMDESSTEKVYLEKLLTDAGWYYTIVTNANDFALQLRAGGYSIYALLSEKITLTPQTRDALKLLVAAGDGLFVANGHDRRHQSLEDALGVRVHAKQAQIKGVSVDASVLGDAWSHTFDETFNSMTFDTQGATVVGRYVLPSSQGNNSQQSFGAASSFNVFALENFTSLSSTVEGRIAVGGNLNLQNFSVGDKLDPIKLHDVAIVGGNVTFPSGRVYYGNLIAGGSVTGVGDAVRYGMAPGAVIRGNTSIAVDFASERDYLQTLSADIAALSANGTVKMQWGGLELKGNCTSAQQVFNVNANDLAIAHTFAVSCIPSGATVIFNIPGQSATIQSIGMQSLSNLREKVLFNFPQAKTLTLKSVAIEGSVLAPYAVVEQPAGRVEGQVIVKSWNSTNRGFMSIHNRNFKGDLSALTKPKSTNAVAVYQYQQGKTVFASFDVLAQALALYNKPVAADANVFAQLLLAALNQVNPDPAMAKAGKVVPVLVTFENTGSQVANGQSLLMLSANLGMIQSAEFAAVPNTTTWALPFTLQAAGQVSKTLYVRLPASGSAAIQFKVQTSPDGTNRIEKALSLNTH